MEHRTSSLVTITVPAGKKMAPLLGPLVKEAKWRVESGMAMQ
jgi:hypothetical protein